MRLSIVIPAHNEEGRIGKTLFDYLYYFKEETEFLVIVNGCRDKTYDVVEEARKKYNNNLIIENIKEAIGKGGALRRGFELARGELISFVDADEATSPEEFDRLIREIQDFDGVIASRSLKGAKAEMSFFRKLAHRFFSLIVRILFRLPFSDTQCGAKVFKKAALKNILPELRVNNMICDVEILAFLKAYGYKIREVATVWSEKSGSGTYNSVWLFLKVAFNMFITLLQLKKRFIYEKRKTNL